MLEREMESFYGAFLEVVAKGSNKTVEEVAQLARGRVWSGSDAARAGLVDRLGGLDAALDEVWKRLPSIPDRFKSLVQPCVIQPRRIEVPPPEPPGPVAAWMALADCLAPELADAVTLATGPDRVLMYALGLPRIT